MSKLTEMFHQIKNEKEYPSQLDIQKQYLNQIDILNQLNKTNTVSIKYKVADEILKTIQELLLDKNTPEIISLNKANIINSLINSLDTLTKIRNI